MALKRNGATSKLILRVAVGTDAKGAVAYGQRSFAHINPALSDADFLTVGKAIGALQMYAVSTVNRQDVAKLEEEA